jgi:hypothetical protein
MKLTSARIDRALSQIDGQAVSENDPVTRQLNQLFGDHTFFLDGSGLNIVEPAEPYDGDVETGRVVKVARWVDESRTSLAPHAREDTDVVVVLGKAA